MSKINNEYLTEKQVRAVNDFLSHFSPTSVHVSSKSPVRQFESTILRLYYIELLQLAKLATVFKNREYLHQENPALKEAWDKYITMEQLTSEGLYWGQDI